MTDYFPHTQGRDGVFFVSESLGEKSLHSRRGDANTFHAVSHALTHSYTYLSDRTWLCTYFSINPPKNKQTTATSSSPSSWLLPGFPFLSPSSFLSCLPPFFPSFRPRLPLSLRQPVGAFTRRRTGPDARTPLSRYLSPSPSLPPLTHACTHSEWQLANFYTAGSCLATPCPTTLSPPLCLSLFLSLHL